MMKNCINTSRMKMMSTQRLMMKRPSAHRSAGMSMKPTSTGVMMAVKMSAIDVTTSQLGISLLVRGSRRYFDLFSSLALLRVFASWSAKIFWDPVVVSVEALRDSGGGSRVG